MHFSKIKTGFVTNAAGLFLAAVIAVISTVLGGYFPVIGASIFGIVIGIAINNTVGKPAPCAKGLDYATKKVLKFAIILVGAGLSFSQVLHTGAESFLIMLFTLSAAFFAAFIAGKLLGVSSSLKSLIGVGTAICGGSAIAAIAPIIEAEDRDISYSISTVFLFNIAAVFIFPPLGHIFGLSDHGFGLWAGTAINDTSSVVAAGYTYSSAAGDFATIVKLTRTTMIVPIAIAFAAAVSIKKKRASAEGGANFSFVQVFPWFILGFLAMSLLTTTGWVPVHVMGWVKDAGRFCIVLALSAIGLKTDFRSMIKTGWRPLFLGCVVWFSVASVGILVQYLAGQW